MTDTPPDRLSNDPDSPYHDAALLERGIGIRFKGVEKTNVEEYCVQRGLDPQCPPATPRTATAIR